MEEDHQFLRHWYDALSRSYEELYGQEQASKHDRILRSLQDQRFETLVDVGCGTGRFLERASQYCTQSVGIDVSGEMLRMARSRLGQTNIEFVRAASPWLPLRDSTADCIVSISLIESRESARLHFEELERVKTARGISALTVFEPELELEPRRGQRVEHSRIGRHENLYVIKNKDVD